MSDWKFIVITDSIKIHFRRIDMDDDNIMPEIKNIDEESHIEVLADFLYTDSISEAFGVAINHVYHFSENPEFTTHIFYVRNANNIEYCSMKEDFDDIYKCMASYMKEFNLIGEFTALNIARNPARTGH